MVQNPGHGQQVGETSGERKLDLEREGQEMDLQEARSVKWFKSCPRPMGELFDEGYLYQTRLAWAADSAYDPRIREAAKVLLGLPPAQKAARTESRESKQAQAEKRFNVGLSLEQARAKPFPFGPGKGKPMGELLDAGQLALKDLAVVVDRSWDDTIRRAAMALLLQRLDQILKEPPPSTGLVEVVSGGRPYSEYKQLFLTWFEGTAFGFFFGSLLAVAIVGTILNSRRAGTGRPIADLLAAPGGYVALGIVILIVGLLLALVNIVPDLLSKRIQRQIDDYRRGQAGEDAALEVILQTLDGSWKVFRNLQVPVMKRSDIDFVLVGPPGVWAVEVKNLQGEYRNVGDTWEYKHGNVWKRARAQPSQEARAHAAALGGFMKADGLHVFANPAVVWVNPENAPMVDNPSVAVWTLDRLPDELGNIWYSKQMPTEARERIIGKLMRLCDAQRAHTTTRH